jgi:hypothetical protein
MQLPRIGQVVVFCVLVPGCSMYQNAARNLFEAPIDAADECSFVYHNREIAGAVWKDFCRANPRSGLSADYACGFIDGYADYLDGGGKPREPVVPPWSYRRNGYLTPAGRLAVEDWHIPSALPLRPNPLRDA